MSYILDALKKSEAERSNRDHAEFAHRVPFEAAPRRQREIWPYLLVLALIANALVVVYVMWPQSGADESAGSGETAVVQRQESVERETTDAVPEKPVRDEAEAPETAEAPDESAPVVPEETPSQTSDGASQTESRENPADEQAKQEPDATSPSPEPEETEAPPEVPGIDAMPSSVQRRVPEMTFNAHLYSSNPSSRQVMINNRKLREGDRVGDLVIKEITPAGAVFRLDEHVFQIGIVRDWQGSR